MKYQPEDILTIEDVWLLLDYITNLQKEVRINNDLIPYLKNKEKSLKKQITNLQKEYEKADYDRHKLFEQKEKAIEYIKELCYIESKNKLCAYGWDLSPEHILNILQGEDKNE